MPLYDYQCATHGKFEAQRSIKECDQAPCPACKKKAEKLPNLSFTLGLDGVAYNRQFCNGSQFTDDPETGDFYRNKAKQAGVSTTGKVYRHSLAEFPGDPQAWTSDLDDAVAVCKRRGYKHKISGGVLECQREIDLSKKDLI